MRQILHISDVHFGPPHLQARSDAVLALVAERKPDLVVVSGDLTQRAKPEQFRQAREFVGRMESPTLTVPGNHDVPLYRVWERFISPYGAYRRHFDADPEPVYRDEEMLVAGINTAHGWTFTEGRIRRSRLAEVGRLLEASPEHVLKVIVAHHPMIPPPRFGPQHVLRDARPAIDVFSRLGVDIVLSGHKHQAYIGSLDEFYPSAGASVLAVHAGTTTSNRGRGCERHQNSCNWVVVDAETVTVSSLRWADGPARFVERSRHWYPRRARKPHTLEGLRLSVSEG